MTTYGKPGFYAQRKAGWGTDLYRNRSEGWIAGVCAGLADYWNVPNWMVRTATVLLFFVTGSLAFWGYVAGVVLMASRRHASTDEGETVETVIEETVTTYRPRKSYRKTSAPTERLRKAQAKMDAALGRIEEMETYVTSRRYELDRKFSRL